MTKTYKGFEALERMKTNWIQKEKEPYNRYKFEDGVVKVKSLTLDEYLDVQVNINLFFNNTFVDYVEPLKVGDIVKVESKGHTVYTTVMEAFEKDGKTLTSLAGVDTLLSHFKADRITEEEFELIKRKEIFRRAGRNLDEFRKGDIVEITEDGKTFKAEVKQQGDGSSKMVEYAGVYYGYKYGCDVKPIKFVTYTEAADPKYVAVENEVTPCTGQPMPPMMGGQL